MSRLFYQPVGAPQLSNAAAGVSQAALALGSGLSIVGEGLTKLGERRERRLAEKRQRDEARALEGLSLLSELSGSEGDLNALAAQTLGIGGSGGSAGLPIGFSDVVRQRRQDILNNNTTRESNRTSRLGNDKTQFELDGKQQTRDFQNEFGADINRARQLASTGDIVGAQAIEADVVRRAGNRYGTNPAGLFEGTLNLLTTGDDARTGVETNALELIGLRQDQRIQREEAADANRSRDYNHSRNVIADNRADVNFARGEIVAELVAGVKTGAYNQEDAIRRITERTDITPREKEAAVEDLRAQFAADPDLLDTFNPLDPNYVDDRIYNLTDRVEASINGALGTNLQLNSNSDIPVDSTVTGIQQIADTIQQTEPSLSIFNEVQNVEASLRDDAGNVVDLGTALRERYSTTALPDKWINRIERKQRGKPGQRRLTDAEVLVIADRSMRARGANFLGLNVIVPGNQRADERILDVDLFDQLADDYRKNNPANLAAKSQRINGYVARSNELRGSIRDLEEARGRAISAGDEAAKTQYDRRITDARDELAGIARRMDGMLEVDSNNR